MGPKSLTTLVLLTAAALGSWYLASPKTEVIADEQSREPAHRGYYLEQARILGTGADGSLLYEIEAQHAEQQLDDRIEFTDVRIRYSPGSEIPWVVQADQATIREGAPRIALRGHVQISNNGESRDEETEIRTQYLELDPDRFLAETDERVQIRFGVRSVTATGMLASLNDNRIELRSNVRGKIVP